MSSPIQATNLLSMALIVALCVVQEAGFTARKARTIGIAVDHRRKNRSLESLQVTAMMHMPILTLQPAFIFRAQIWKSLPAKEGHAEL